MIIKTEHKNQAAQSAKSYKEFHQNLIKLGYDLPGMPKFPMNMKSWGRRLRFELSKINSKPTTAHDVRQKRYYERLERLGYPEPLFHM